LGAASATRAPSSPRGEAVVCRSPGAPPEISGAERRPGENGMFERFSDRARRVVVLAQEEARMLNQNYIGTEHILLGLIQEGEGVAAKPLESLGISLEGARRQGEESSGQGQQRPSGHLPFPRRARNAP